MLPRAPLPFVGRESVIGHLLRRLETSPLVILKGLTGSGKTATLLHLLHQQSKVRSVHYVRLDSGLGLEPLLSRDFQPTSDVRAQTQEWVRAANAFSSDQQTPLWVIDDFHLLGSETAAPFLRILNTFVRAWVILSTREELPLSPLERVEYSEEKLGPLDASASEALLAQLLQHQGITTSSDELQRQVTRLQGHPLRLRLRAATWNETDSEVTDASLVQQLCEGLGHEGRELLHCLSLCGTPIDEATISSWPQGSELNNLARKFLVERLSHGWFVPRLVAEQFPSNPALHRRLSLEYQRQGNPLEALHHALRASDGPAAREYLELVCRQLCARGEYQELFGAITQLEEMGEPITAPLRLAVSFALSNRCQWEESLVMLSPLADDPSYAIDFLSARAGVCLNRGDWSSALGDYARVMQLASPGSEQHTKAIHYSILLHAYRHETAQARQLLDSLPSLNDEAKAASLHRYRMESIVCHFEGRAERALETAKKAVEMAEQQGSARQAGLSSQAEADALCDLGLAESAIDVLKKTLSWTRQVGETQVTGYCLLTLGRAYRMLDREVEAATTWQDCEMVFLTVGHRNGAATARCQLMKLQLQHGTMDLNAWQRCFRAAQECGSPPLELELWHLKEQHSSLMGLTAESQEAAAHIARLGGQPSHTVHQQNSGGAPPGTASASPTYSIQNRTPDFAVSDSSKPLTIPRDSAKSGYASKSETSCTSIIGSPSNFDSEPSLGHPSLAVKLLGGLRVKGPRKEIGERDWPTRKSAGLFALLCYAGPQGYSDERLMAAFWPDSAIDQARSSLRSALHQIRQVLKDVASEELAQKLVRSRKTGSVYLECPVELDVAALDHHLKSGSDQYLRQEYAEASETLALGLRLYQAEFLESFREEWTDLPRDQSREKAIDTSHLLALSYNAQSLGQKAEDAARAGLALDPLREELHMDLMEAFLTQGRKAEALRHYKRSISQFEKELSIYPRSFDSIFPKLVV